MPPPPVICSRESRNRNYASAGTGSLVPGARPVAPLVLALHSHSLALFHSHSGTAAGFVVMSPGARPPPLCYAPVPEHKKREPFRFARPVPALSRPSWLAGVPGWRPSAAARFFALVNALNGLHRDNKQDKS